MTPPPPPYRRPASYRPDDFISGVKNFTYSIFFKSKYTTELTYYTDTLELQESLATNYQLLTINIISNNFKIY